MNRGVAWAMWGLGAGFYAYGFFQRVAPATMTAELMRDLALGGALMGTLAAAYFYAYAAVQVPMGLFLDRFGPRLLLAVAALFAAAGSAVFASAGSLGTGMAGRVLVGVGAGAGYVGALKLASSWFPPQRFGLLAGLTLAAGTCGAILAQISLAWLVPLVGWRATMAGAAAVALAMALLIAFTVRDSPEPAPARPAGTGTGPLRLVLASSATWRLACVTGFVGAPILTFAGLWGVPWLVQAHGLTRPEAGLVTSAVLAAWAFGGPFCGGLSDRLGRRRPVMAGGAAVSILAWATLLIGAPPSLWIVVPALVAAGVAGGAMVVAFAAGRDRFGAAAAGTMTGVVNTSVLLFAAGLQTLTGWLLDRAWDGTLLDGARVYDADAFRTAFAVFPACALVALVAAWGLAEGRACRSGASP